VQDLTMTDTAATVARGFGGGWGLEAVTFLRHLDSRIRFEDLDRRPIELPGGDIHHRDETLVGPGDPWLTAVVGRPLGPLSAAFRAGVTIPLGRTEENPFALGRRGRPHQHIQFGTGTWDPLVGAGVGRRFADVVVSANVLARLPVSANGHGYRAGRRLQATLGADRRVAGAWRVLGGLDYGHETAETWDGVIEEEGYLGRSDLLLSAGVARAFGARALVLSVKVPLRTRAHGVQVDYPAIVVLGWAQ
jgi:hypothetical protein